MEIYIKASVNTFCDCIRKFGKNGELSVNMSNWIPFMTFDIVGDFCFGKSFGLLEVGVVKPLMGCIERNTYFNGMLLSCPGLLPLLRLSPHHLKKARTQLGEQSVSKVKKRMANQSDRKDFLYYLTDPEKLKRAARGVRDQLYATCAFLIVAGGDTISIVLNGAIYLLATHHDVLEKLHRELIERFPDPKCEIEHHKTVSLTYLNAVIEESMRLYPAGLGPLPRVSSQENVVAGQKIPANCIVSVAPYAISRDTRYFTRPENFIPERWIDPGFERDQTLGKLAFQPFSLGPRGCLGRNMAYMELRLFLAHFVLQFRPELEDPKFCYENRDHWTAFKPPLFVKCHSLKCGSP
ncbi:Isotrichodermin C-15 hydroxylase [Neolecta irregularis DAH-3]|uniref:Isotrichodermin C-15 hydroxylase n=1 Tax=Neolecta irregularis (strain DAH-3) TaxID=1198029 RepID=A0A1U7LRK9_NEOID|nr:Isotrichodermin C-15 hydroxylase [Neolecta irregularis DAH-3]|eukprot:OLL25306.1 Isotrichodermin C-15 hydroxylase [Neolecta irregularis DAH-3]